MNTNRINNKNTKRIAIAAGAAAAALFLTAGFVASRGNGSNNDSDTPVLKVPAPVLEIAATPEIEDVIAESLAAVETAPVIETKSDSAAAKTKTPASKRTKKSPVLTGGSSAAEEVTATPAPETTTAPASHVAEAGVVEAPVVTVPAEQPAVDQPVDEQAPAPAETPTAAGSSTWVNIPKIVGTPSLASTIAGLDLSKLTSPQITIPKPCIPGLSC